MFKTGDTVVYGNSGVCRVDDVREERFGPVKQMYYVLRPVRDAHSTFYCPVAQGEAKMRRLLSAEEIRALIRQMPAAETVWVAEDAVRREQFNAMLKSGDHRQIIRLIKTLYLHRQQKAAEGKRLHLADERVMNEAERLLYEEFAHVLAIRPEDVVAYIEEELAAG